MTFLLWLYQFIGAVFLGFMINTVLVEARHKKNSLAELIEFMLIIGLAIVWPYAFYLIYRQEMKA